jgi:hypothetical protein
LRAADGFDTTLGVFSDIIVERILAFQHGFVYVPGIRAVFRVAASTLLQFHAARSKRKRPPIGNRAREARNFDHRPVSA